MILDFISGFFNEIVIGLSVWTYSKLRPLIKKRIKQSKIQKFFGKSSIDKEKIAIILPLFKPLSFDDFNPAKTKVKKSFYDIKRDLHEISVPMYSDTIVVDDYHAFQAINRVMNKYGIKPLKFVPDDSTIQDWRTFPCRICIGGPRSNLKLNEAMHLERCIDFISFEQTGDTLETWSLQVSRPKKYSFHVDHENGIGVIIRIPNPDIENDMIVGLFGCRAESTVTASEFFENKYEEIAKLADENPLIILISMYACQQEAFCNPQIMFAATPEKVLKLNETEIGKYGVLR